VEEEKTHKNPPFQRPESSVARLKFLQNASDSAQILAFFEGTRAPHENKKIATKNEKISLPISAPSPQIAKNSPPSTKKTSLLSP
jgi:hypothetical protein